jgi:hypothetical protein
MHVANFDVTIAPIDRVMGCECTVHETPDQKRRKDG